LRNRLRGVDAADQVAQLGSRHRLLELGAQQAGGQEAVLLEEDVLVEGHVGDADRLLVAERAVISEDRDLVHRIAVSVQAAMAIVITDGVGGREIGHPTCLQQWIEPGLVLSGNSDRASDGQSQGHSGAHGLIEDLVEATQVRAAERG
jgi:hypothetical protein